MLAESDGERPVGAFGPRADVGSDRRWILDSEDGAHRGRHHIVRGGQPLRGTEVTVPAVEVECSRLGRLRLLRVLSG